MYGNIISGENMAKKKKAFGGYTIKPDKALSAIVGKGAVTPSQMTKNIWQYIKRKRLGKRR